MSLLASTCVIIISCYSLALTLLTLEISTACSKQKMVQSYLDYLDSWKLGLIVRITESPNLSSLQFTIILSTAVKADTVHALRCTVGLQPQTNVLNNCVHRKMTWIQGIGPRDVLTPLGFVIHLNSELRNFQNNQTTLPVPLEETNLTSK